jgi:hypothetical protein
MIDDTSKHYRVARRFFAFSVIILIAMSLTFLLSYLLGENQWILTVVFASIFGFYMIWIAADISVDIEDSKYKRMLKELGKKE